MLFGMQHSQSRENINFPEDESVGGIEGDGGPGQGSSPGLGHSPRASTGAGLASTIPSSSPQARPPGNDNEPVNVTITVSATG
ncbi:hypothetical protein AAFF_G00370120 [Aldrovandia affinis]|uniref:Uncharacterized protein n=1 Tax=Aldrovandia affinis TaxID=143900 RepID=A0AAD7WMB6_9TELE|nr:hypothetical protein AAFF_G00370120 [Aldrovandia affinis]